MAACGPYLHFRHSEKVVSNLIVRCIPRFLSGDSQLVFSLTFIETRPYLIPHSSYRPCARRLHVKHNGEMVKPRKTRPDLS